MSSQPPLSIIYAIPDHPWVDAADGADVRVAMSVGTAGPRTGKLGIVCKEIAKVDGEHDVQLEFANGRIQSDLSIGPEVVQVVALRSNLEISWNGMMLAGKGFLLSAATAQFLRSNTSGDHDVIKPFCHGHELVRRFTGKSVVDLYGLSEHQVCDLYPTIYQYILEHVKPHRVVSTDNTFRKTWWLFGRQRPDLRRAITHISRYICTTETSKYRLFHFLNSSFIPDHMIICIALDDAFFLGVLSSRIHVTWALAAGGTLEDRPRYNKTRCFDPFPFPNCDEEAKARIRELGERLDRHRKDRQSDHPTLTLTQMYNVLERLRAGTPLSPKEREIHDQGLVSLLKEIHDELDAAVSAAYGWPLDLTDEQILERLVALNRERAAEEANGHVRWLRPEFQAPQAAKPVQQKMDVESVAPAAVAAKRPWPSALPEQVRLLREALAGRPAATADDLASEFRRAPRKQVAALLVTLAELGHVRATGGGRFVAAG